MLLCHHCVWHEAIDPDHENAGANVRLKRLTIDVLLPGPTTLDQIRCVVSDDGKTLHFTCRCPQTCLNPARTAVRVTHSFGGDRALGVQGVRETMAAASRVQAHRTALEQVRVDQQEKVRHVALPFEVDRNFCRRDDWGNDNRTHGIEIGICRHENPEMQADNQCVWILHVELSARERPVFQPVSPGRFQTFAGHAQNTGDVDCLCSIRAIQN